MSRKKKKIAKNKKKFFIILACYIITFILTSVITTATLAWYNSSTWQAEVLYMGGPVYIYFSDDTGVTNTSGKEKLVVETPPGWTKLYPGMNINFEAKAVIEGEKFTQTRPSGETVEYFTTGAVLRAKIGLEVKDPSGSSTSIVATDIYNWIWPQLRLEAVNDMQNEGVWVFDELDASVEENNYFYYVVKNQNYSDAGDYTLLEVGGMEVNDTVGFLNNVVIQLPAIELTNEHADCTLKFTIVFEAVQAFFPYELEEVGQPYLGDTTGRSDKITIDDVGLDKPLTVENSRKLFNESMFTEANGYSPAS